MRFYKLKTEFLSNYLNLYQWVTSPSAWHNIPIVTVVHLVVKQKYNTNILVFNKVLFFLKYFSKKGYVLTSYCETTRYLRFFLKIWFCINGVEKQNISHLRGCGTGQKRQPDLLIHQYKNVQWILNPLLLRSVY